MGVDALDQTICPSVLGMTKCSIAFGRWPHAIEHLVIGLMQQNTWSFPAPQDKQFGLLHPHPLNNCIIYYGSQLLAVGILLLPSSSQLAVVRPPITNVLVKIAGTIYLCGTPKFITGFQWGSSCSIFSFADHTLFVVLYLYVLQLYCLFFFDLRHLTIPLLVSSQYSQCHSISFELRFEFLICIYIVDVFTT